jgi:hypothetical protein
MVVHLFLIGNVFAMMNKTRGAKYEIEKYP